MIRFLRPFDPRRLRLLVFDLDGTLIDSRLDLIHSVNAMLRHIERPELDGDVIASYVGDGAPTLVRRALGDTDDEALLQKAMEYFLVYYRQHKLDHTTVYEGIPEVLARLANSSNGVESNGVPPDAVQPNGVPPNRVPPDGVPRQIAVLSNKPVNPSRDIVRALGLGDFFVCVYGGNSFTTKKPDPLGVRTIMQETGVAADEALIIGDSAVDVLTGRNAGLWTCGVTYGFAPHSLEEVPPDVLVESPRELGELLR
ncbi:MAG: HAD-IA family hydrolase [Terriglobales bacterium]